MVHRPMRGWHCQSLGKVCWGSLVAFHFPTGPARADHDWIGLQASVSSLDKLVINQVNTCLFYQACKVHDIVCFGD